MNRARAPGVLRPTSRALLQRASSSLTRIAASALLASLPCISCIAREQANPPVPGIVRVRATPAETVIDFVLFENDNPHAIEVCLKNVVITAPGGDAENCGFEAIGGCLVVDAHTMVGRVPFRAP